MSKFIQLHILTPYPPSNPNRDDLGRPKTAMLGGLPRMRISSQAIKRAIRTSDVFSNSVGDQHKGLRTRRFGPREIIPSLVDRGIDESKAIEVAEIITEAIASIDTKASLPAASSQIVFFSAVEIQRALELAHAWATGKMEIPLATKKPAKAKDGKKDKSKYDGSKIAEQILLETTTACDLAMFGRMLTGTDNLAARYSMDAAVQVSHALTTNRVEIEDDYFTAVDDLKRREEDDAGAGFIGEAGFGAGVFYLYICVDIDLLVKNLKGDRDLALTALEALVRAAATASPSGKRNSYANHVRAEFILAEIGDAQPRTLANAFLQPVGKGDQLTLSAERLMEKRASFAAAYGQDWTDEICLQVGRSDGATLDEIAAFAGKAVA